GELRHDLRDRQRPNGRLLVAERLAGVGIEDALALGETVERPAHDQVPALTAVQRDLAARDVHGYDGVDGIDHLADQGLGDAVHGIRDRILGGHPTGVTAVADPSGVPSLEGDDLARLGPYNAELDSEPGGRAAASLLDVGDVVGGRAHGELAD